MTTVSTPPAIAESPPPPRRGSSLPALIGLALVALGTGMLLVGSSLPTAGAKLVGSNNPVNAGAKNRRDISANNSPSLAGNPTDPDNVVVANRIDTPSFSCALHVSFDAGTTWAPVEIPFPEGEEAPPRCFAPDLAFDSKGTLFLSFVTLRGTGNVPNASWIVSSTDGGRTLSKPAKAFGEFGFGMRLAADPTTPGRLYLSWLQSDSTSALGFPTPGNPIQVARSDDGGTTWSAPVRVSPPARARAIAPTPAVGPNGELYVAYIDLGDDALDYHAGHEGKGGDPYPGRWELVMARSDDQGVTWKETVVEKALAPTERFIVFFPPTPSVAVDPRGDRVYAAFHDGGLGQAGEPDSDVLVWTSTDKGATFGRGRRVNDTPRRDGTTQYLPRLAVAPGGRLDVAYYDRRSDEDNVMNEVSLQSSTDGGATFTGRVRLSDRPFDSRIGFGSERAMPDIGSRLGLLSTDDRILAVWTDTRSGTEASNKQDLARAVAEWEDGSPLRTPLRTLGVLLVALGLLTLMWWLVAGRKPLPVSGEE